MKKSCWILLCSVMAATLSSAVPAVSHETQIRYLSGTGNNDGVPWDFMVTAGMQSGEWKKIAVPSNWELQGFGVYNYGGGFRDSANAPGGNSTGRAGFASEQGKYKTTFDAPEDWKGKVVRIVFDGVMTKSEVWVNGQSAGPAHEGSFYQFKYDITPLLKFGESNLLEVTDNTIPGATYSFKPEFKGYFRDWRWATFDTAEGKFSVSSITSQGVQISPSFLGVYTPTDGSVGPLMNLPQTGLAFLDVIPAQRDKFLLQDQLGPQSAMQSVTGRHQAAVLFDFGVD